MYRFLDFQNQGVLEIPKPRGFEELYRNVCIHNIYMYVYIYIMRIFGIYGKVYVSM